MSSDSSPEQVEQLLARRAEVLARRADRTERELLARVVSLKAGGQRFGVPVTAFEELMPMRPIAHLASLPPWLAGLVQVRGELVSVLDLAQWFQVPGASSPRVLALLSDEGRLLAVLVDEVLGFRDVYADEVSGSLARGDASARPVLAVTNDLELVLDPRQLFSHPDVVLEEDR